MAAARDVAAPANTRNSIRSKWTRQQSMATFAALFVATLTFFAHDLYRARERAQHEFRSVASVVAQNCAAAVYFEDDVSAAQTLASLNSLTDFESAWLRDTDGRLRASLPVGASPDGTRAPSVWDWDRLLIVEPVVLDGDEIGTLTLRVDLRTQKAALKQHLALVLFVLVVSGGIAHLLARRFVQIVTDPILHLSSTASGVQRSKDFSVRVDAGGSDEIGQLIAAFNAMLAEIEHRDQRLRAANQDLERQVVAQEKAKKAAEEASVAKSEFLANMS
ncbi:MAG: HAMP domain-containing protein, partial [Gemmatimonadetes bacterium]|nr:HAMP domain-containing protein [Gemmatimonadota bacterium]